MTLIEILVVMVIMAVMMAVVVVGSGQSDSARLRQAAALVTGAIRVGFSKSSARAKPLRLVFDFNANTLALEESEDVMLLTKDPSGTGGAAGITELERAAIEEGQRIVKGPQAPRATFKPMDGTGFGVGTGGKAPKPLPKNIGFRSVHCEHEIDRRTEQRGYLYFFPGGQTERCVIQLGIGKAADDDESSTAPTGADVEGVLSLVVSPLTGKVVVKPGALELEMPEDDKAASEREEPGGTL
jgi:general secretion pathway protein H